MHDSIEQQAGTCAIRRKKKVVTVQNARGDVGFEEVLSEQFGARFRIRTPDDALGDPQFACAEASSKLANPPRPAGTGEPDQGIQACGAGNAWQVRRLDPLRLDQDEMPDAEEREPFDEEGADTPHADDGDFRAAQDILSGIPEETRLAIVGRIDDYISRHRRWQENAPTPTDDDGAIECHPPAIR